MTFHIVKLVVFLYTFTANMVTVRMILQLQDKQVVCVPLPDRAVPHVSASPLGAICDSGGPGT